MASIAHDYVPIDEKDFWRCLADPMWRICSGQLYKIVNKEGKLVPFRPNKHQTTFLKTMWYRNTVLKARQLGYSTVVDILWLDHALFNRHQRCDIVAHDLSAAKSLFRDKIRKAYDNLPAPLLRAFPLKREAADELLFAHNESSIRVSTSARSGTINRLHVSEFGKIGAKYPDKAREVVTGSLPAVPPDGIIIIESTAEGQSGYFYDMAQEAIETEQKLKADPTRKLSREDYKIHFSAWWESDDYETDPTFITITEDDEEYFRQIESVIGQSLSARKRAWYVAFRDKTFGGDPALMWQEMPSTPEEAFRQSEEGTYYARELATARLSGRITKAPHADGVPVNTFWDIGNSDGTGIWFHQRIGAEHRFLQYTEAWGEPYSYFIKLMQAKGWIWGTHYLPHDASHKRQQGDVIAAPVDMLRKLAPGWRFDIVPRVNETQDGIQLVRDIFSQCWFDEAGCKEGLRHLDQYKKQWNARTSTWSDQPKHDEHSEAADAFRQFAQGWREVSVHAGGAHPSWRRRVDAKTV